jgi:hypothetical protein
LSVQTFLGSPGGNALSQNKVTDRGWRNSW